MLILKKTMIILLIFSGSFLYIYGSQEYYITNVPGSKLYYPNLYFLMEHNFNMISQSYKVKDLDKLTVDQTIGVLYKLFYEWKTVYPKNFIFNDYFKELVVFVNTIKTKHLFGFSKERIKVLKMAKYLNFEF